MARRQADLSEEDADIIAIIEREEQIAYGVNDSQLSEERANAIDYYLGKPFGNEVEGRSQVVSFDVQDTVEAALPQLLKIFTSGDQVVRFDPKGMEDEDAAEQETDYINHVVMEQNDGFATFYTWFKDALISKNGYVKVYYEEQEEVTTESYQGITDAQLMQLVNDDRVTVVEHDSFPDPSFQQSMQDANAAQMMQAGAPILQVPMLHYVKIELRDKKGKICIDNIAPEDMKVSVDARGLDLQNVRFIQHSRMMSEAELEDIGIDIPEGLAGDNSLYEIESNARDLYSEDFDRTSYNSGDILVKDTYLLLNGKRMRYLVAGNYILLKEDCEVVPFVAITPMLMPHRHIGRSYADLTMDIQLIKSTLIRGQLDNMYLSNNGRYAISDRVNLEDMLTSRPGGVVRVQGEPSASIMPLQHVPFPPVSFTMVEYMDTMKEKRTGITSYNQGLDSESLNKMLALDTPIPLIDGSFKLNGEIVEGDTLVGSNGKGTVVKKAHPVQMPERAFRITFKSGDVIKAGGEHRWSVKVSKKNYKDISPEWEKLPTHRIYDLVQAEHRVWVPRVEEVDFTEKDLPIDPYVFGVWLGDGHSHTNRFTSMDQEIVSAVSEWASKFYGGKVEECKTQNSGKAKTYNIVNTPFRKMLKDLGCLRDSRYEETCENSKHIPEIYLRGSFEQRLSLLRGLMDTDGCIDKNGNSIFCNSEPALVETFARLIESLGGKPNIGWRKPKSNFGDGGNARPHAHVTFKTPYCPVSLPHKAERWVMNKSYWERQAIVEIVEIPIEPMRCLTVAAEDELYCCGNRFTLTSNTATGITAIMNAAAMRLELVARLFAETGVKQLFLMVHRMVRKYYTKPDIIRLRNKWVEVDPRAWSNRKDMTVNVGLGTGNRDAQLGHLMTILAAQKEAMAGGLNVVNETNLYNALVKLTQNAGFKNPELFWTDPKTAPPKQPQEPPEITIKKMELQAKQNEAGMAIQASAVDSAAEHQLKQEELQIKKADTQIKAKELQIKEFDAVTDRIKVIKEDKVEDGGEQQMQSMKKYSVGTIDDFFRTIGDETTELQAAQARVDQAIMERDAAVMQSQEMVTKVVELFTEKINQGFTQIATALQQPLIPVRGQDGLIKSVVRGRLN